MPPSSNGVAKKAGDNWYFSPTFGIEGWLCPALFKYFEAAPKELYAKAEPLLK